MQNRTERFLDKIVKKDYNNELEIVLENKYFYENVKSILLSILYKIEAAYKDYEIVKQNVDTKEEFIKKIINIIKRDCKDIKLVNPGSDESKLLGDKTFLVDKEKKKILCYNIERKLLYCISKISKNEKIVKDKYFLLNTTFSNMINTGNNINMVEPLRDFNGYSWVNIPNEIESITHNLIYQNLIMLVGNKFLNNWIGNKEFIIDYYESFQNKLDIYGEDERKQLIDLLNKLSILLEIKFNKNSKGEMFKIKSEIERKLEGISDKESFIQDITEQKKVLTDRIRIIDETINNKKLLQKEYERRNEKLELSEKIFSVRILSKMMEEEREEKIKEINNLNKLLNPQQFVKYKKELKEKHQLVKILDNLNLEQDIEKILLKLQKVFLKCFETKINKVQNKSEAIKAIFELRYYKSLPFNYERNIGNLKEIQSKLEELENKLIKKANELKAIENFSKDDKINYLLLKHIFNTRIINLEDLCIKIVKEKNKVYIYLLDKDIEEEKIEYNGELSKNDITVKINKNIKVFY